jgi:hypothetical protein
MFTTWSTHLRKRLGAFGFFLYLVGFLLAFVADGFSCWGDGGAAAAAALSLEELVVSRSCCSSSSSCKAAANSGPAEMSEKG